MTSPEQMWRHVRRLLPEADLVVLPSERADTWIGRAAGHPADAAESTATRHLTVLWPVLTGGLPHPPTAVRSWTPTPEGGAFLDLVARREGPVADLLARVERAARVLGRDGWTVRHPRGTTDARLLAATRGYVTAELLRWPKPAAVDVAVRVGPLDAHTRQPPTTVPFPRPARPE